MTARSIRRAAERKAKKKALKATAPVAALSPLEDAQVYTEDDPGRNETLCPPGQVLDQRSAQLLFVPEPAEPSTISSARLAANKANAQHSTGATTSEGKAKSCLNAVKTALTGRTVLLPTDDAAEYERHVRAYEKELRPVTQRECDLAQSLADISWRLKRIPALEMAIFAQGRLEFAESFKELDPSLRPGMMELQTFFKYEKQIRNLQLQEARLARRREKETAELRALQQERNRTEADQLDIAAKLYLTATHDKKSFVPADHGFEFSTHDVEKYLEGVRAAKIAHSSLRTGLDMHLSRAKTSSHAA